VYANSYDEAQLLNREVLGKGLSRQSWAIVLKIREVDELLEPVPEYRGRVREVHPEVCFWGLLGFPIADPKKTRAGSNTRLEALEMYIPDVRQIAGRAFLGHGGFEAQRDDVLHAIVAALCAGHASECLTLPDSPVLDDRGLPMEMVYWPAARS
jgi:predicted RNase H-like nuclease